MDDGDNIIYPEIAWGNYKIIAQENNLNSLTYNVLKDQKERDSYKSSLESTKLELEAKIWNIYKSKLNWNNWGILWKFHKIVI